LLVVVGVVLGICGSSVSCEEPLSAWWSFDEADGIVMVDSVTNRRDSVQGNFWRVEGVKGRGLKFDGFTSRITRAAADAPQLSAAFTVEAWVAPQAYPWNWCAIVNQQRDRKAGYFFGIDQVGHVGLHLAVDGRWRQCTTEQTIPFMTKWSHIAGTFDEDEGITVYIDGKVAGRLALKGRPSFAEDVDLEVGRNHKKTPLDATALVRPTVNFPTSYSFDGIIDELKIYNVRLSAEAIRQHYEKLKPEGGPALQWRKLPAILAQKRFGAAYCRLAFYPEWDALWRVGEYADVVVSFDEGLYKMVFWRGTNYNMNLVTENGRWVGDQSAEEGGRGAIGCCEHMSDKQCRYAHVRIIESHDARVVVHWRYALCDVLYRIGDARAPDNAGNWGDEYYYIYPDGVALRHFQVHGVGGCSITEPTILNQPGQRAEDNVEVAALTMANLEGQQRTYTWDPWPGSGKTGADFDNPLVGGNICVVNLKSRYKPFYIYEPGTRIIPYGGGTRELRAEYSHFPTWNHWPVCQAPSDGRYALAPDRVSSSAITSPEPPMTRTGDDVEGRFIMGLTDKGIEKIVPLARSWVHPAKIKVVGECFRSEGYDRNQRAYIVSKVCPESCVLGMELAGNQESPVVNPVFVISNWGQDGAGLRVNGKELKTDGDFRYGLRRALSADQLVVWVRMESETPTKVSIFPVRD